MKRLALALWVALPALLTAQQNPSRAPGQTFGNAEITVGMKESEAIAKLADQFTISRFGGSDSLLKIAES